MKLNSQALEILEQLKQKSPRTVKQLEKEGFDQSMVNRAALELEDKGLVIFSEEAEEVKVLTDEGENIIQEGSPEFQLVKRLENGSQELSELQGLNLDVALGKARQKGWIELNQGEASLSDKGAELEEDPVKRKLENEEFEEEFCDRGLVEKQEEKERILELTEKGAEIDLEEIEEDFNVEADVKTPRTGKKHFYRQIMDYARQKWVEMGFEEMSGDYVTSSFICMDALFIPQDHPARELQDTFFLETPEKADLSEYGEKIKNVKETHESGWNTGSSGWSYDWEEEEAAKNVLRTHTTAISAQRLHEIDINEEELPKKFFSLGRAFRNETVDRTHLAEFYQTDGIVVGKDVNFKHLKGYISEFFEKMGYSEFRLIPSYYPYTEMSVEVQVWDEEDEEWLGMGGAGMFRPEVVKPLLGFEAKVLAWGLGIGRIAMINAELNDIRELYRNDIEILEETDAWRPDKKVKGGEE